MGEAVSPRRGYRRGGWAPSRGLYNGWESWKWWQPPRLQNRTGPRNASFAKQKARCASSGPGKSIMKTAAQIQSTAQLESTGRRLQMPRGVGGA